MAGGDYVGGSVASRDLREGHLREAVFVIGGQVCEKRPSRVHLHEFCDSVLSWNSLLFRQ